MIDACTKFPHTYPRGGPPAAHIPAHADAGFSIFSECRDIMFLGAACCQPTRASRRRQKQTARRRRPKAAPPLMRTEDRVSRRTWLARKYPARAAAARAAVDRTLVPSTRVGPRTVMIRGFTYAFAFIPFHSGFSLVLMMCSFHAWHIVLCEWQQGGLRPPLLRRRSP